MYRTSRLGGRPKSDGGTVCTNRYKQILIDVKLNCVYKQILIDVQLNCVYKQIINRCEVKLCVQTDINRCEVKNRKERSKTELTSRSTVKRRRFVLDCSAK
jgi:hypothetical protein